MKNRIMRPLPPPLSDYYADTDGVIWHRATNGSMAELKQYTPSSKYPHDNYARVHVVHPNDKSGYARVHVLIALAFHGEPSPGQEVRHLNGDSTDNRPSNLAWGTRAENKKDEAAHRAAKIRDYGGPGKKLCKADARNAREMRARGMPVSKVAERIGISVPHASRILNDHCWSEDGKPGGNYKTGESRPSSKLTEEKVRKIKRRLAEGVKLREISEEFGVTMPCISNIRTGRTWGHIE